jgi:hypothetical protein
MNLINHLLTTGVSCLVLVREPQDQVVRAKDPVTLHCTVRMTSSDEISSVAIVWHGNQTGNLPHGSVTNTTAINTTVESILAFPTGKFYSDYEGLYHCVVKSQNRSIQSRRALIRGNLIWLKCLLCNYVRVLF